MNAKVNLYLKVKTVYRSDHLLAVWNRSGLINGALTQMGWWCCTTRASSGQDSVLHHDTCKSNAHHLHPQDAKGGERERWQSSISHPPMWQQAARFKKWGWKETMQSDSASVVPNLSVRGSCVLKHSFAHTIFRQRGLLALDLSVAEQQTHLK